MKGKDSTKKLLLAVLLVVVAVAFWWRGSGGFSGKKAASVKELEEVAYPIHEVPDLALYLLTPSPTAERSASRNPFLFGRPPTPTPGPVRTLGPRPTPTPTPTPELLRVGDRDLPPPPPFDMEYIGYFGPKGRLVAVFKKGDDLEVAMAGHVVEERFIVRAVGFDSVEIGFVGYPEEVTTSVPIATE